MKTRQIIATFKYLKDKYLKDNNKIKKLSNEKTNTDNRRKSEYYTIIKSLLISFVLYEHVKYFTMILKTHNFSSFAIPPSILLLTSFLLVIEFWYNSYQDVRYLNANIFKFMITLIDPVIFYSIAITLTPNSNNFKKESLMDNFLGNKKTLYGLVITELIVCIIFPYIFSQKKKFFNKTNIFRIIAILGCIIGLWLPKELIIWLYNFKDYILAYTFLLIAITYLILYPNGNDECKYGEPKEENKISS